MSDFIRLAVTGAGGRMGRAVIAQVLDDARFKLAAAHSRSTVGQDAGMLAGRSACGVAVIGDLDAVLQAADVVIDFTRPTFTLDIAAACAEHGRALVSGTTGMTFVQREQLAGMAMKIPLLWAPNMSVGVNLLLAALADIAARLGEDYDAEIVETHHRHKVDAPSGTALALGETLAAARGRSMDELAVYGHSGGEPRQRGRIGFHSLRGGEIAGEHDVRLIAAGEEVRLGHSAFGREAFTAGALRAAAWLHGRAPGFYGMRDVLELSARQS